MALAPLKISIRSTKTLGELWDVVQAINQEHFPENSLAPILGGGQTSQPKVMFVFINPTVRNISSNPDWKGPRFPFIGTKQVWRVFHQAGLFDDMLMQQVERTPTWSVEFTNEVLDFLQSSRLYLTNLVKWTGSDATLPDSQKRKLFLPVLEREIELVRPGHIVTFGLMPFENLTGRKIRLADYHSKIVESGGLRFYDLALDSVETKVIPSYFPVGRGDPKRAVEILKLVADL